MSDLQNAQRKQVRDAVIRGALVTLARVLVAIYALGITLWCMLAEGLRDASGTVLGADFINVYAAGVQANSGQAVSVYDEHLHGMVEQQVAGYAAPYVGWHYPPLFLMVAAAIAVMPYLWAFALYMGAGLAGYFAVLRKLAPAKSKEAFWLGAAFPGLFDNIINGQNGLITVGLFGAGMAMLETRPWLAGVLFGLMVYKPQFFILIPLLLLMGGYGRALLAACATAAVGMGISWVIFGTGVWQVFFSDAQATQHVLLEQNLIGWQKIQSVFSLARLWGCDVTGAYLAQGITAFCALGAAMYVWRGKTSLAARAGALCAALLLSTPYVLDYDLVILAVPLALLAKQGLEDGFCRGEKQMLAALWFLPLLARAIGAHGILIAPFLLVWLMGVCVAQVILRAARVPAP